MKYKTIRDVAYISLLMTSSAVVADEAGSDTATQESGMSLAFGGDLFLALQNWPDVGMADDTKLGFGLGGSFGIGARIDDMTFLIGPQFAFSRWSADYSDKPNSATDSVYAEMYDAGMQVSMQFDSFLLSIGKGQSTISSGMIVNGSDIKYPYDGDKYDYSAVAIGAKFDYFMLGLAAVNYDGYAKYCNRAEIRLGLAF